MSRRDEKSLKESISPLLRSKSKKTKPSKEEKDCDTKEEDLDHQTFLRYGRSGRRNTLPTLLIPNEEDSASDVESKQKCEQEIQEKHAHDHLPFLDSFIKKKNKLRQSFHGTRSSPSSTTKL